jgi:hypothetical protein
VIALLGVVGCYAPHAPTGASCANGECPPGLVCAPATQTCEVSAGDAAVGADGRDDAARDAAVIDGPPAGAALVQEEAASTMSGGIVMVTLPQTPVAGHVLVMIGGCPSGELTSVTGGVATWTRVAFTVINSNIEIHVGVANGGTQVTVTRANGAAPIWAHVSEWSGLAAANLVDAHSANDGLGMTAAPGPLTTTHARDLLILGVSDYTLTAIGAPTPGTWTALKGIDTMQIKQGEWYESVSSTGTYDASVPAGPAGSWDAAMVALRIAP